MPADYSFIQETIFVIGNNEASGNYGAVNAVDVVSIGIFQWYGSRAYDLCYSIFATIGEEQSTQILGADLVAELKQNASSLWNDFLPTATQRSTLSTFITTAEGRRIQDELATTDAWDYIKVGQNYGLTDGQALIYFADLYNQSPRQAGNIVASAGGAAGANSLDAIHNAAMKNSVMNKYSTRRNWTYNELKEWAGAATTPPPSGGGGWVGGDTGNNSNDYVMQYNNLLILYSQQYPAGRVYIPSSSNIFYPKS